MNYITSCPKCDTHFLLTTEHIKAHRGKVQCGHCEHVFNAKNRLTEAPDDITTAEEYQASVENSPSEVNESEHVEEIALPQSGNVEIEGPTYIGEFTASTPKFGDTHGLNKPTIIEDLSIDPRFSKKKSKFNFKLFFVSLLLISLAALQTVYFMRSKIAAEYPNFKPLLVNACAKLNCKIDLPRNLDFFVIDDSDMQEDETYQSVINFSSALINNASYAQAYPNIELTLTNTEDQPVLRRLIKPKEYLPNNTNIENGIRAHEEIRIKLAIQASGEPVAGYRVLLVY